MEKSGVGRERSREVVLIENVDFWEVESRMEIIAGLMMMLAVAVIREGR